MTPDGRFLCAVSDFPEGIATSPDGQFVYAASVGLGTIPEGPGALSGFSIGGDGALTPVPGSPFAAGLFPVGITVAPTGRFVYTSGGDASGELNAFGVGAKGTLRLLPGSSFPTGAVGPGYNSASVLPNQGPVASFTTRVNDRSVAFDASAATDADGRVARYHGTSATAPPRPPPTPGPPTSTRGPGRSR